MVDIRVGFCSFLLLLITSTEGNVPSNTTTVYEGDLPCFNRADGQDMIECAIQSFSDCKFYACFRDSLCQYYGDCCGNYSHSSSEIDMSLYPEPEQIECTYLCESDVCEAYFMVTKCPSSCIQNSHPSEQMAAITQLCEESESLEPPITHITTGLVYKNRYCALCNKVSINEMIEWQSKWICTMDLIMLFNLGSPITSNEVAQFCEPMNLVPPNLNMWAHEPRSCDPRFIKSCPAAPPNYLNKKEYKDVVSNCTMYGIDRVSFKRSYDDNRIKIFSNPYCAICNLDRDEIINFHLNRQKCIIIVRDPTTLTFTFFFSPQVALINEVNTAVYEQAIIVATNKTCSNETVYLPYMNVCREKVYFGGNQSSDCNYISLNASEYTSIDSVTLLRLVDNKTYAIEGLDGSNNPIICYISLSFSANTSTTEDSQHTLPIAILSYLGIVMDVISGFLIVVTYLLCLESRTLYTHVLLNMVAIYVVGDAVLVIGDAISSSFQSQGICVALAIAIHFTFLARFFSCTAVLSIAMRTFYFAWKVIPPTEETKKKRCQYLALCLIPVYSLAAIIVVVCIAFNFSLFGSVGYGSKQSSVCWMSNVVALSVSFVTPLCLSLMVNTICFIFCSFVIIRNSVLSISSKAKVVSHQRVLFEDFRIIFALFSVSGISWIFFVLILIPGANGRGQVWGAYIFIILNSSQLFLVALAYICTKKVLKKYYQLLSGTRSRLATLVSSASSPTRNSNSGQFHTSTSV